MNGEFMAEFRSVAPPWAQRPILAGLCGSHAHGTHLPPTDPHGTDDTDVFAVTVQPAAWYLGVAAMGHARQDFNTNGAHLDVVGHDVRKFVGLLGKGNPNVHTWVWSPDILFCSAGGRLLIEARERMLSKRIFPALKGYAAAQLHKMTQGQTQGYMGAKRKELLRQYGYDIKDASHCIRLLYVGIELARNGRLMVRLDDDIRETVMAIKRGEWTVRQLEREADRLFAELHAAEPLTALRDEVPMEEMDRLAAAVIASEKIP